MCLVLASLELLKKFRNVFKLSKRRILLGPSSSAVEQMNAQLPCTESIVHK